MTPILAEYLPDMFVLWSFLRQPELDLLVLYVSEVVARVNQFLKAWLKYLQIRIQISRLLLLGSFKVFNLWKRLDICAFLFNKYISLSDFFSKTKSLLIDLAFINLSFCIILTFRNVFSGQHSISPI